VHALIGHRNVEPIRPHHASASPPARRAGGGATLPSADQPRYRSGLGVEEASCRAAKPEHTSSMPLGTYHLYHHAAELALKG
jgi:hypothetical protein